MGRFSDSTNKNDSLVNINAGGKAQHTYDAIVVGSGISGGWAAKELCERGLKTLVLERGHQLRHIEDYKTALKNPWELPHNNRAATNADRAAQPIQSTLYLYDQSTKQHF